MLQRAAGRSGLFALFFVLIWTLHGCASASSGPALWKLQHEDTTVWLYGTFHLLPEGTPYTDGKAENAFHESRTLILEADTEMGQLSRLISQYGIAPAGAPWTEKLTADERAELENQAQALQTPVAHLERFRPWMAALYLTQVHVGKMGFTPQAGVEAQLSAKAKALGKEITYLETAEEQIRMFADLPEEIQLQLVRETLQEIESAPDLLEEMKTAWLTGDTETLARTIHDNMGDFPELKERLLLRRNRNWATAVEDLLPEGGTIFLAVGAGHLVGEGNLVELLRAKGYTVTRQ